MKRTTVTVVIVAILVIAFVFSVYNSRPAVPPGAAGAKIRVTTSFYPLYFFAAAIGGDKADVFNVTPAGAEPHDYEPTAQDIVRIEQSKLLILNGVHLEPWGEKVKSELQGKHTVIVSAGEDLGIRELNENGAAIYGEQSRTIIDPHVWLDPLLAKKEAEKIAQGYAAADPNNARYYEENLKALEKALDELDKQYREGLNACKKQDIVTSHAAFGYLAQEYHLNQLAIAGLSPDAEPSPARLVEIAKFVDKNNIKYIFFESLVSPKLSQAIADETGAQTLVLNPIEGLSDEELKQGKSYITEMQNNLENLRIALECPAV